MKTLTVSKITTAILFGFSFVFPMLTHAEMLALVNYQSKPNQTPKREGLAIIDLDLNSANFAKIITDIPLPTDLVAHHVFYNKEVSKAYVASLGSNPLQVIDMKKQPYTLKTIAVPACQVAEDLVFSADKKRWFVTCMGSSNVIMGDAETDKQIKVISASKTASSKKFISHPHGIGINDEINRIVIANTLHPTDFSIAEETVTVLQARSGKVLSTHKMSDKASPSGVAPVEAVFLPKANPARVYISTAFGNTLWTGEWDSIGQHFKFSQLFDFSALKQGVPLEIYFNHQLDKMYITTASPGYLNIFTIKNPAKPILEKSIPTAEGAHHVVFSPDERYAFVQNNFLDLPAMNDGSISVIDLQKGVVKMTINTFKEQGLNPNAIVMMPKWYHDSAH